MGTVAAMMKPKLRTAAATQARIDQALLRKIDAAIALLTEHGYTVRKTRKAAGR